MTYLEQTSSEIAYKKGYLGMNLYARMLNYIGLFTIICNRYQLR